MRVCAVKGCGKTFDDDDQGYIVCEEHWQYAMGQRSKAMRMENERRKKGIDPVIEDRKAWWARVKETSAKIARIYGGKPLIHPDDPGPIYDWERT